MKNSFLTKLGNVLVRFVALSLWAIVLIAALVMGILLAMENSCTSNVISSLESPSGLFTARVVMNDCNATTQEVTRIVILQAGSTKANELNIIFHSPTRRDGTPGLDMAWTGDNHIEVSFSKILSYSSTQSSIEIGEFTIKLTVREITNNNL